MFWAFQLLSWKWGRGLVAAEDDGCQPKDEGAAALAQRRERKPHSWGLQEEGEENSWG